MNVDIPDQLYGICRRRHPDFSAYVVGLITTDICRGTERSPYVDELTGCRNSQALVHDISIMTSGVDCEDDSILQTNYLCVEIKSFRTYNDTHGFHEGDKRLQSVASVLMTEYQTQYVYRIYGDGFVVAVGTNDHIKPIRISELDFKYSVVKIRAKKNWRQQDIINNYIHIYILRGILEAESEATTLEYVAP